MTFKKTTLAAVLALMAAGFAHADITIGVVQPLTGPASGLGIPVKNGIAIWPKTIAGETLKVVVLDDATDPTTGVKDAQRLVTEDKADIIIGSSATPVAIPMADVTAESGTPQLSTAPAGLPPGKDKWFFRLPQSNDVMAYAVVAHMKKQNVKTVGFLGYTDAYGELWLKALTAEAAKNGIKIVATERFARADTSVTGQVLKLTSANPDAILIVASGSGAGMPQKAVMERGYKGKVYQTHAAATQDLMRTAGKDAEGTFVVSGPATVAEQLPDSHPSKAAAVAFVQGYEKAYGPGSRNQFAGHAADALTVLEKAVPVALKKAKPGTPEFRAALRDALEGMGRTVLAHGVLNWTAQDHWGYTTETGVMLKVVNGAFKVEQ
ncbi:MULTISPECIES: ABC transporter substrate-binding protein [Variovorax]|jgi:branched-chain amino acid transport system substrate-binding protein|uniref:ABC transporter substrate-binding protein n=1 Tax=Variovorax TaxID=34072 RepID=UPI00086A5C5B|nr:MULTISPECIES: ABC transporter substrate-binding protein [Variovorax]MBN8752471.1 ABC transporter substrate-binding protein [Variovorax sp.]ODU16426.1 MAG: branched-chain amino acid ABC transporter substrate-binding protein [Variovorax sp. SCN 67-85]ODV24838.1 MAG: branched-chain amino acid ABC transporter substrate-binding protein [Variovorax sp. SCN 67-20]OJZ10085.1 MAG: branched-chain amino acid ABC transporter substrate-binding protein [Variovorax sp. 67-131]UKI06708.1 ABC transporter su